MAELESTWFEEASVKEVTKAAAQAAKRELDGWVLTKFSPFFFRFYVQMTALHGQSGAAETRSRGTMMRYDGEVDNGRVNLPRVFDRLALAITGYLTEMAALPADPFASLGPGGR